MLPNFFYQAITGEDITVYGDGSQTRSFCYVEDEIRGLAESLKFRVDTHMLEFSGMCEACQAAASR